MMNFQLEDKMKTVCAALKVSKKAENPYAKAQAIEELGKQVSKALCNMAKGRGFKGCKECEK